MGIDLTIAPQRYITPHDEFTTWFLAFDRISFDRDYILFDNIRKLKPHLLPESTTFQWYGDDGLKEIEKDAYGDTLTYVNADDLAKAFTETPNLSYKNKAIKAYIEALPPSHKIVLWWD